MIQSIGIDLHGVADTFLELLMPLMEAMKQFNMRVVIVSGPPADEVRNSLTALGYVEDTHYDYITSVVDYLKESGAEMWQDNQKRWWTHDEDWWAAKAAICKRESIDMLIDDSHRYMSYFEANHKTKFVLVKRGPKNG